MRPGLRVAGMPWKAEQRIAPLALKLPQCISNARLNPKKIDLLNPSFLCNNSSP
jgi:hypothetical protein